MKIILVNNFISNTGGAEKYTVLLGNILKQNGHEVFYYATNRKPYILENVENSNFFPEYLNFRGESRLKQAKNLLKSFYNLEAQKNLDLLISKVNPDIIHFNCINYHLTSSLLKSCKKHKIPTVMTLHDARFGCPGGTLLKAKKEYCQDLPCFKGSTLPCVINRCKNRSLLESLISALELAFVRISGFYKNIDGFVCPSNAVYELALAAGLDKKKLNLIYNFLDEEAFKINPDYKDENYFLYAGRLVEEKGVNYLLEAMSKVPEEIKLKIAGSGDQEDTLKHLAKKLELNNVEFLGFVSGDELKNAFKNCIANILPCNYFEAFGLSTVESFAYGKPVIASNRGAVSEIIMHNSNGLIFEPCSVDELAQDIKMLFYDRQKSIEMGKNARVSIEKYSPKKYYNQLIDLYNNLIQK